ncbi:MAG: single-stranded-DNA-specific exonuclease RecJ [Cyanobacteriota bacterium]
MEKIWNYKECDEEKSIILAEKTGLTKYTSQLLINRGIEEIPDVKEFLKTVTKLELISWDYEKSKQIAEYLKEKIANQDLITVHGDYDVDGVTGAAVLCLFLRDKEANFNYYLPDRFGDGYGLASKTVENLHKNGTKVIITADCAISNYDEIEYANSLGIDVIVTDHHTLPEKLPNAKFIYHPALSENKNVHILSGVGTAFQLISEINDLIPSKKQTKIEDLADLVAIGTIADISPLKGVNRNLVKYGLTKLKNTKKIGLIKLMQSAGIQPENVNYQDISFKIVPRLNATGRMNKALVSLDLILSETEEEANEICEKINRINKERQELSEKTYLDVEEIIKKEVDLSKDKAIFIFGKDFHHGVIGIICSKVLEKYNRPVFINAIEGDFSRGSGRSKNIHLANCLKEAEHLLVKAGGHAGAAGWTVKTENLEEFKKFVLEYTSTKLSDEEVNPQIELEIEIPIEQINYQVFREVQEMEPFGLSNPEPVIYAKNVKVDKNTQYVSTDERHLFFEVFDKSRKTKAVFWNKGHLFPLNDNIDLIYSINEAKRNGRNSLRLRTISIKSEKILNDEIKVPILINKITEESNNIISDSIELDFNIEDIKLISDSGYIYNSIGVSKINFLNKNVEEIPKDIEIIDMRHLDIEQKNIIDLLSENKEEYFNIFSKKELNFEKELTKYFINDTKLPKSLILYDLPQEKENLNYILNLIGVKKIYLFNSQNHDSKINANIIKDFINCLYANNTSLKNFIFYINQIKDFRVSYFKYIIDILVEAEILIKDKEKFYIKQTYKNIDLNSLTNYKKYLEDLDKYNIWIRNINNYSLKKLKDLLI